MIAIHQNRVKVVQTLFADDIKKQREKALEKLIVLNNKTDNRDDKTYLENVISLFENNTDILLWDQVKLETEKDSIGDVPLVEKLYRGKLRLVKSPIKNIIIKELGYKSLRSSFYPQYFEKIGIKACVYCNSQLTITAIKSKGKYSAKFDVDHYHSKDEYPFLSICLYNLYPACASCNRAKSNGEVEFNLYTNDGVKTLQADYQFKLTPYSKAKYLVTRDVEELSFIFEEPDYDNPNVKTFNEVFHIESIYETQKDVIEELIIKSQIYNQAYLKTLKLSFNKLSLHPRLYKRTLIGNYTEDKDIHKRPMSKFMMDIAKDLDLI